MSQADIKRLARKFRNEVLDTSDRLGMDTALVSKDGLHEIIAFLRDDEKLQYDFLRDVTCVDYLHREPRFEVVYVLYSMSRRTQVVIKAAVGQEDPTIDTVSDLFGSANWGEREVWDMYGIRFKGHPDMRRILLYEEFEGHPLRKDYDKQRSQPRMPLLMPERDAKQEFDLLHMGRKSGTRTT